MSARLGNILVVSMLQVQSNIILPFHIFIGCYIFVFSFSIFLLVTTMLYHSAHCVSALLIPVCPSGQLDGRACFQDSLHDSLKCGKERVGSLPEGAEKGPSWKAAGFGVGRRAGLAVHKCLALPFNFVILPISSTQAFDITAITTTTVTTTKLKHHPARQTASSHFFPDTHASYLGST